MFETFRAAAGSGDGSWNFSRASEYELLKLSAPIIHFSQSFILFHSQSVIMGVQKMKNRCILSLQLTQRNRRPMSAQGGSDVSE